MGFEANKELLDTCIIVNDVASNHPSAHRVPSMEIDESRPPWSDVGPGIFDLIKVSA